MNSQAITADKTFEQIFDLVDQLCPVEQVRLIGRLVSKVENFMVKTENTSVAPLRPMRGYLAHLGPAPSSEDIEEVRREMWASFD